MPPIKFKPTEKTYNRRTDTYSTYHYYMKATPKKELIDYLNKESAPKKKKHKVLKELQRRNIKLIWKEETDNA